MAFFLQAEFPLGTRNNTCLCCNAARRDDDVIVDIGVTIDFEGHLMICSTCVKEMAELIGFKGEASAEQSLEIIRLQGIVDDLHSKMKRAKADLV